VADGVYEIALGEPFPLLARAHLRVSIRDRQGNVTRVDRVFSTASTAPRPPAVAAVVPNHGLTTAATAITIRGTGFQPGAAVTLGAGAGTVAAGDVVVVDATTITATAPPHATGAVRVTVTNPDQLGGWLDPAFFYSPPPSGSGFYTLAPCRLLDTRRAAGPTGGPALAGRGTRTVAIAGGCGIPPGARAVAANVTVVPAGGGFLSLFPGNAFPLGTSSVNFVAGLVRANNAILQLATDGTGTLGVHNASAGANHVIVDVYGYFD
jgi:hypothetical protein